MKFSRIHSHLPKRSLLLAAAALLAFSILTAWFFQSKPSTGHQQKLLQSYVQEQQNEIKRLLADSFLIRKLVLHQESKEEFDAITNKKFGFFVFAEMLNDNPDLEFWNSQKIIPPKPDFTKPDGIYFERLTNGYYVIQKDSLQLPGMSSNLVAYSLIPVMEKYNVQGYGTQTQFAHSRDAIDKINITEKKTDFPVKSIDGQILFHVEPVVYAQPNYADPATMVLRLLALVLILVYLQQLVETINKRRGALLAVASLAIILLGCRIIFFYFPALFSLRQIPLFDPANYAANAFNRSLGDLLLNVFFLCWLVLYAWRTLGPIKKIPSFLQGKRILVAGVAGIFLLIFTTFELALVIYELVANSKFSFDVTNFFNLDIYTAFGFIILALIALSYYYFSRLVFRFVLLAFPNLVHLYFAVAIVGLVFLTARTGDAIVLFYLPILAWLVVYTLLLSQEQLIINRLRITIAGMLFWLFVFSLSLAVLVMKGNRDREWAQRKTIAEKLYELADPSKEKTVSVALAYLTNDYIKSNFPRFYNESENNFLRDSFINSNWLGYANSYNTNFYVFDSANRPVNNRDGRSFEELNNILTVQSTPIGRGGLYYYETSYDQYVYITKRQAFEEGQLVGSVFIVAAPKHFQQVQNLYPNVFQRTDPNNLESSDVYSYAIYGNGKLKNHSSKYPFPTELSPAAIPVNEVAKKENKNTNELWFKTHSNMLVVVAKKQDSLIEGITLFSYLFCAFLFMVGLLRLATFISNTGFRWRLSGLFSDLNIRSQIHSTIIFISVLSFLVIGAATISFFMQRYARNNVDRLSRTANGAVIELKNRVRDAGLKPGTNISFNDSLTAAVLGNVAREIADVHGMIVNIYDLAGTVRASSDEDIYRKGLLSDRMDPKAYYNLHTLKAVQYVQEEETNQLEYQSIYIAVRDVDGNTYAYLNIPSIQSQLELEQEISNFIVTIINLNAFIFLIAGIIALFITDRISRTFSVIGDKMKAITLGKTNEEIVWTKDDEIGELVRQYNKMVQQLEESANALAKSEREGAWREMARQVAHEIKNPLTPMKLSIQYLQRAIQTNQPHVKELTSNVASTLIEQIDHLSKIAADFSQFANIGNKKLEEIDLHSVIRSLYDLYSANPRIELQWNQLPEPLFMRTDKTHMNRLITNLLTNAVDACSEARKCMVTIDEKRLEKDVIISIRDNGEGIPVEMRSKIFTPNFTTKTSGTGLGLAMCKSITEQAGGSIWFETEEGVGTTFFVQLPLSQ